MENTTLEKLVFIYNADSGLGNLVLDTAHKLFSPKTYACNLCDITFGAFTEATVWKKFRQTTALEMEFLHKDEFEKQYASKFGHKFSYPIVLTTGVNGFEVFIGTQELDQLQSAGELIAQIEKRKLS